MATGIRLEGEQQYARYLAKLPPLIQREVRKRNLQSARLVQSRARRAIGRRLSDRNRRRGASGRGLGSFTGTLASKITFEAKRRGRVYLVEVGPEDSAIWGWIHETGAGKFPARPWFGPVVESLRGRWIRIMERVLRVL